MDQETAFKTFDILGYRYNVGYAGQVLSAFSLTRVSGVPGYRTVHYRDPSFFNDTFSRWSGLSHIFPDLSTFNSSTFSPFT